MKMTNVPLIPYPPGADYETRMAAYEQWKRLYAAANPGHFNRDGTRKTFMQRIFGA